VLLHPEVEWYFCTLSILTTHIGNRWAVVMRANEDDDQDVSWYVVPCDDYEPDEMEDLSEVETHPDRLVIKYRDGILFAHPTSSPRSIWMSVKLKDQPELAGRII
jgi:hypothetical protein